MIGCFLRDFVYAVILVLALPMLVYRRVFRGRYQGGWGERFGFVPRREAGGECLWVHAVSVGEVNAARTLVSELAERFGELEVVISTTTDTGMARARGLWGGKHKVFYFPWDFSWAVGRAFGRLRPRVCVMMEGEIWPNFTAIAARRGAAVVVANGRVGGDKGWPRYRRFAGLVRGMFQRLSLVLAQDETAAERFRYLGAAKDRVQVVGSLKYDTAEVVDQVEGAEALAKQLSLSKEAPLWVAGSTGPGEEAIVLESYGQLRQEPGLKGLRLVIVPRKPERFEEVGQLIASRGYRLLRYSHVKSGECELAEGADEAVILGDTMGDLRKFYSLADVVFVGRSLVPMGGSDMMEVAALGKAVVTGPYTENFMEAVRLLIAEKAIEVVADGRQLKEIVRKLLLDPKAAGAMGRRGREVIVTNQGATRRSVDAIASLLGL